MAAIGLVQRDGSLESAGASPEVAFVGEPSPLDRTFVAENTENRVFPSLAQFQHGRYDRLGGRECSPWVHMATASQGRSSPPQLELLRYKQQHQRTCQQQQQQGPLHSALPRAHPNAMARRNERERKRVRMVNMGFATLRQYLPHVGRKKLSKMETLCSAIDYIKQLQRVLDSHDRSTFDLMAGGSSPPPPHPPHHSGSQWSAVPIQVVPAADKERSQDGLPRYPCSTPLWEDSVSGGWVAARSPGSSLGSEASSPPNSLSPEEEILDFALS